MITNSNLNELVGLVRTWGEERGIIGSNAKATQQTQFSKLLEEVDELNQAITQCDKPEIIDAIGDCTVVLILLAELAQTSFEDCLASAYDVIATRSGKMVNGMFVKDTPTSIDDDLCEDLGAPQATCTDEVCESCQ
jgi:NTP pyrophosphatase (non-canonical NTP hydrolase)